MCDAKVRLAFTHTDASKTSSSTEAEAKATARVRSLDAQLLDRVNRHLSQPESTRTHSLELEKLSWRWYLPTMKRIIASSQRQ